MSQDSSKLILERFVAAYRDVDVDVAPIASEFVSLHAEQFLSACGGLLDTVSLGSVIQFEERWREYVKKYLSEPYVEHVGADSPDFEEVLRSEGSHLLLLAQRLIFREVDKRAPSVSALLALRYPLLVLSFPEFIEKFDSAELRAQHYLSFIVRAFEIALAEEVYPGPSDALAGLLSNLKSPYRHASEFFEYGERLDTGAGLAVHTVYELLLEYTIRDFELEEKQYRDQLLPDNTLLKSPFSQESIEILMVFWAKVGSELFSSRLIAMIPEYTRAHEAPQVVKSLDEEFFKEFGQDFSIATVEFPHIQQETMLLIETNLLEKQLKSAVDVDTETRAIFEEELANAKNLLWEVLHQGARDVIWDIERHNRLLPQLKAIRDARLWDKEEVQAAIDVCEEIYAGLSVRQEDLEYRISVLQQELSRWHQERSGSSAEDSDKTRGVLPYEKQFSDHFSQFAFRLMALNEGGEAAEYQQEAETVLAHLSESCSRVLTRDLYQAKAPEEFLIEDPIVSSVFDVPSHTGALADYVRDALAKNELSEVEKQFEGGGSLLQVVQIADALEQGQGARELESSFPAHLITVVRMRRELETGASIEELKQFFPEDQRSLAMLQQRLKLEQVIRKHCLAVETCYSELKTDFLKRWHPGGFAQRMVSDATLFEIAWDWYCLNTNNHYESLIQKGIELPNIKTKRVLFKHWFAGTVARALEMYAPELFALLLRSRPSEIFSAQELGDFNYSDTLAKQVYTRSLADSISVELVGHDGEQAFRTLEQFCDAVYSPYRDFLRSDRYPLGEYFEACFFISVEQARLFPTQLRRLLLENWVDANDRDFYGDREVNGWLFIELLERLRERQPEIAQKVVSFALYDEKKRLQAMRKSPLEMLSEDEGAVAHSIPTRELELQMQIAAEISTIEYLIEQSEREASLLTQPEH